MALVRVGRLADLWQDDMRGVRVADTPVLLVRCGTQVRAFEDRCAHLGQRLSEGSLQAGVITCRAHGWCYDALTGAGKNPRNVCLATLPVELRDGEIWVDPHPTSQDSTQ